MLSTQRLDKILYVIKCRYTQQFCLEFSYFSYIGARNTHSCRLCDFPHYVIYDHIEANGLILKSVSKFENHMLTINFKIQTDQSSSN